MPSRFAIDPILASYWPFFEHTPPSESLKICPLPNWLQPLLYPASAVLCHGRAFARQGRRKLQRDKFGARQPRKPNWEEIGLGLLYSEALPALQGYARYARLLEDATIRYLLKIVVVVDQQVCAKNIQHP